MRLQYMYALAFCIFLDLVWLDVASGVKATIAADGLANQQIPRMIAVGCSTANLFLKVCFSLSYDIDIILY
jgi:uncharacterized transporter YbjL